MRLATVGELEPSHRLSSAVDTPGDWPPRLVLTKLSGHTPPPLMGLNPFMSPPEGLALPLSLLPLPTIPAALDPTHPRALLVTVNIEIEEQSSAGPLQALEASS